MCRLFGSRACPHTRKNGAADRPAATQRRSVGIRFRSRSRLWSHWVERRSRGGGRWGHRSPPCIPPRTRSCAHSRSHDASLAFRRSADCEAGETAGHASSDVCERVSTSSNLRLPGRPLTQLRLLQCTRLQKQSLTPPSFTRRAEGWSLGAAHGWCMMQTSSDGISQATHAPVVR